ncbi:bifunctional endo-1,4-beta-xylanase XylA-like [Quillaja saponaria]|uniref:Bifunctional endo-1,4-beta-xylanase XylA-like n=1 Tax=Quillaja saponaria TaxID=32244 RepID=A0AAD7PZM7_QUISA|nr:bifunctional endo-1,4-beta-xylanase XylA-like [Quillaja saponaria]
MSNWRQHHHHQQQLQRASNYRGILGARPQNWKPPLEYHWQATVPLWEKKFCREVGSISWRKILEAKKFMFLYDNVVQWDDSAAKEAFDNAKRRFWEEINGIHCKIPLPDPELYLDDIDWDSNVDSELLLDLDNEQPMSPTEGDKDENVVIFGDSLPMINQSIPCTGWSDDEGNKDENIHSLDDPRLLSRYQSIPCTEWGDDDVEGDASKTTNAFPDPQSGNFIINTGVNSWGQDYAGDYTPPKEYEWGKHWNKFRDSYQKKQYGSEWKNKDDRKNGEHWGRWNGNDIRETPAWQNMSRYKTSRFHNGNDGQMSREGWRNHGGRKRENFVLEKPCVDNLPAAST